MSEKQKAIVVSYEVWRILNLLQGYWGLKNKDQVMKVLLRKSTGSDSYEELLRRLSQKLITW